MKGSILSLFLIAFITLFLFGCDQLPFFNTPTQEAQAPQETAMPVTGTVIATINNYPVTLEDLDEEIAQFNRAVPPEQPELKVTTKEKKIDYLKNEIVRRILLYQEAKKRGLENNTDIQRTLEKTKQQLLVFQLVKEETDRVTVDAKEIEEYYESFKEQLKEPEERKLREIVVVSQVQAKDLLIRLLQGEDFATLAKQYSKAASAEEGGDLGYITQGQKFKEFDDVAFSDALEVNQVSSIFKGQDGYYIVKLEGKRGGQQRSLSDMWDDIKRGLTFIKQQKRLEELVGNISASAKIEIKEDLL